MGSILSNKSVSYHSPSSEDWEEYKKNIESFKEFKVPKIFDEKNKHDYLFIALADGTENDMKEPSKYTNVANLEKELEDNTNPNIASAYVSGVGTYKGKGNILDKTKAKFDAALSLSHEERVKEIYEEFSKQANIWKSKDPNANISIVEVGFSRGSGVVSLLNQMIHTKDKLFKKTRLPSKDDPSVVIHHSEEHSKLYKKEKQRGITLIDKKVYQKKIASLNISKNDNSKLLYSPIYTNSIKEFKIQKLKKAKTIEKEISRKERFIRFR